MLPKNLQQNYYVTYHNESSKNSFLAKPQLSSISWLGRSYRRNSHWTRKIVCVNIDKRRKFSVHFNHSSSTNSLNFHTTNEKQCGYIIIEAKQAHFLWTFSKILFWRMCEESTYETHQIKWNDQKYIKHLTTSKG